VLRATLEKPSCPGVCWHSTRTGCPLPSQSPVKTKANSKAQGANSGHPNCLLLPVPEKLKKTEIDTKKWKNANDKSFLIGVKSPLL